jgi:hypothetical protein
MDAALKAFDALVDYEVADVTAGATYYMAEMYFDFSQALMDSERPDGLDEAELRDYEMVLEEEAFPFEELAIEVHEKNLELLSVGVFNKWIERSLVKLAAMMPGRYAKFETSPGLIPSIDHYAYRAPRASRPEPEGRELDVPATGEGVPTEPVPAAIPDMDPESAQIRAVRQRLAAR